MYYGGKGHVINPNLKYMYQWKEDINTCSYLITLLSS